MRLLRWNQLPNTPSNNSQLWRQTPDRLPDGASDHNRAWSGDGGRESGASKDGVHMCQDRCSRVPEEAKCLERRAWAGETVRKRTVLFNCKRRSTRRADPLYCSVVPEGQTERESSSAVFGIIWNFRWAAPVAQQ